MISYLNNFFYINYFIVIFTLCKVANLIMISK